MNDFFAAEAAKFGQDAEEEEALARKEREAAAATA